MDTPRCFVSIGYIWVGFRAEWRVMANQRQAFLWNRNTKSLFPQTIWPAHLVGGVSREGGDQSLPIDPKRDSLVNTTLTTNKYNPKPEYQNLFIEVNLTWPKAKLTNRSRSYSKPSLSPTSAPIERGQDWGQDIKSPSLGHGDFELQFVTNHKIVLNTSSSW